MAEDVATDKGSPTPVDSKKSIKGIIVKFVVIPLVLLAQAGVAYYLVANYLVAKPETAETPEEARQVEAGQFFEVKDVVVNPAGTLGRRFLVVELGFETHNPDVIEEAEKKNIWIRDAIISLLSKKTSDDLLDIATREQIKGEVLERVNANLVSGQFEQLYFTKYIVQ